MSKKLRSFALISSLVLLASTLFISGCSTDSPIQPNSPQSVSVNKIIGFSEGGSAGTSTVLDAQYISKDEGGVIEIQRDDYLHLFTVLPGALNSDTEITVKSSKESLLGKDVIVFDFGPDGLVFGRSSVLDFQIAELNSSASSAKLYYYDPGLKRWVFQGSSAVSNGVASFNIDHFSKYAISD